MWVWAALSQVLISKGERKGLGWFFKEIRGHTPLSPFPLSGQKLKTRGRVLVGYSHHYRPSLRKQCQKHKKSPSTMVSLQRASFIILLRAPQSCSKLITATDFKGSSELAYALQGTVWDEKQAEWLEAMFRHFLMFVNVFGTITFTQKPTYLLPQSVK